MRTVKMNRKNIVEYLIGKLVVFILECAIGIGLIFGFFWCIGIVAIASIFKMVSEAE